MPKHPNGPSEFGGRQQRNTIQPPVTPAGTPGHTQLTADEKLRLDYLTGQHDDTTRNPDNGEAFEGILPLADQLERMPRPPLYSERWAD
jgi:hypothetical protein